VLELLAGLLVREVLTLLGVALAAIFLIRPWLARARTGAMVGAIALLGFPAFLFWIGADVHVHQSKETTFCLSCHSMYPYGQSLTEPDKALAGVHFQNYFVPRDEACYTCHTNYTLFGGIQAKFTGLQHMWHAYVAGVPDPIQLYGEWNNRECLRCHAEAPSFLEQPAHEGQIPAMQDNDLSCLLCHGPMHGVEKGEVRAAIEGRKEFRLPTSGMGGAH
jgi:nitrate/TMAO reductase-like tetraheme cytochrome c subunit